MVIVALWNARGALSAIAWCRSLDVARRYVDDARADQVQARLSWPGVEIVLTRADIGARWFVARKVRVPADVGASGGGADGQRS